MRRTRIRRRRGGFTGALVFVALMAGGAYAFTGANTFDDSAAGTGTKAISGYTIGNISYTLDTSDPSKVSAVTFRSTGASGVPDPKAGNVKAKLVTTANTTDYKNCTKTSASGPTQAYSEWSCAVSPLLDIALAEQLTIIATQ